MADIALHLCSVCGMHHSLSAAANTTASHNPCHPQDGKVPQFISWDTIESKVLAVQTVVSVASSSPMCSTLGNS